MFLGDDWKSASRYAYEATDKILKQIETNFQFLPSYDRTLFLERDLQWLRYEMPKIAYYISTDSLLSSAFDGLLFGKGMLLHTDLEIKEVILESNDTTLINLYGDILSKHGELDALYEEKDTMLYPIIDSLEVYVLNQERLVDAEIKRIWQLYKESENTKPRCPTFFGCTRCRNRIFEISDQE